MRILLIEDEYDLAEVIKRGLEEAGHDVRTAHDGGTGLRMAELYPADVIILDVILPVMDGVAVLSAMRKKNISTPVILVTARDVFFDGMRMLHAQAQDCLMKPFGFEELLARIHLLDKVSGGHAGPDGAKDGRAL